jgi:hypothetical protein
VFAVFAGNVWAWAVGIPSFLSVVGETLWDKPTFMHEFGHNLGLPDLYNYENLNAEPVGSWDLMDQGEEELSSWSRIKLGWIAADSVKTTDTSLIHTPVSVLVSPLNEPNGIRQLKVQVYGANAFYLVENRQGGSTVPSSTYGTIRLIIYYIQGSIESGKGSIVFESTLSRDDGKFVYTAERTDLALVLLDVRPDGVIKVQAMTKQNGEMVQRTVESLRSANISVVGAWGDNRVEGFSEAQRDLNKAWEAYENADFDSARSLAGKARELAQLATVPRSYSQFQELRPNLAARLQSASAFKSDEAVRHVELAKRLLANADGNFTEKNFDIALGNLLETNRTLTNAEEAERTFVESQQQQQQQVTRTSSQPIPVLAVAVASAVVIFIIIIIILGLSRATRRKALAR